MSNSKKAPALEDTVPVQEHTTDPSVAKDSSHERMRGGPPSSNLSAETLAGRYELLALLGTGGMGAVYKARDIVLGELVALKVLRADLCADPQMVARFRQEVKLARRVTHANVARTFDLGEHGSHQFLTMELIVGTSLAEVMRRDGALPVARVVSIGSALCAGLAAAHEAGVVHRDLKPDNVLLGDDGRIVINDFGIARVMHDVREESVKTQGPPLGTPAYMSPEQVEGLADVDERADLYALGAILFELFTGTRAWQGDSVFWIASRRLIEPPPNPRDVVPDLPQHVAKLVMKCMAKDRAERYQTASQLASALARVTEPPSEIALPRPTRKSLPPAAMKSVAVLPFRNAGVAADSYLAEGLTDDLIDVLSMTPGLRVCGRGVVMAHAGGTRDPRDIGQDLGVSAVVEGSLRRTPDRLRVSARVVSVVDGFQLWANRFDRTEAQFFEVGDEVARAVAVALTCQVPSTTRETVVDPIALDLFLRAKSEYFKYWRDNVIAAISLFEQALARTPDDPMILSGYAIALARRSSLDDSTDAHADGARRAAERALELAPDFPSAKVALGHARLLVGRSVEAAELVRSVLERNPDSADALDLSGRMLLECGPPAEAIRRLEKAVELEPSYVVARTEIGRLHALLGDRPASDAFFGEEPSHPGLSNLYWVSRSRAALWLGDVERAQEWRKAQEGRLDAFPANLMMLRAMTGDPATPEEVTGILRIASSGTNLLRRRALYAAIVAEFTANIGQDAVALDALESADKALFFDETWILRCPPLAHLRDHPRFVAVRERVLSRAAEVRKALGIG